MKDYDIAILYALSKAYIMADALRQKSVSMGSLASMPISQLSLVFDIQSLANIIFFLTFLT